MFSFQEIFMRELTDHKVNPVNDKLTIEVLDPPGHGGASHVYAISGMQLARNQAALDSPDPKDDNAATIVFQCGPINEHGLNGITQEALLAIVADRLRSFQAGPFSSRENAVALTHIETAMLWLHKRTLDRMQRGVEGKSIV
jgi:hypothetical protein